MGYLQLETTVIAWADEAALLVGMDPDQFLGRLIRLWHRCREEINDVVTEMKIRGLFGTAHPDLFNVLVEYEWLERRADGRFRVKGVEERYLQHARSYIETRTAGGKVRAATAERDQKGRLLPKTPASVQHAGSSITSRLQQAPASSSVDVDVDVDVKKDQKLLSTDVDPRTSVGPLFGGPGEEPTRDAGPTEVDRLVELWNSSAAPEMPRCQKLTEPRRKKARALLEIVPLADWPHLIANANASDFCRGRAKDNGWKLSFAAMLARPELALKVLEGNYANGKPKIDVRRGVQRSDPNRDDFGYCRDCRCARNEAHRSDCSIAGQPAQEAT